MNRVVIYFTVCLLCAGNTFLLSMDFDIRNPVLMYGFGGLLLITFVVGFAYFIVETILALGWVYHWAQSGADNLTQPLPKPLRALVEV